MLANTVDVLLDSSLAGKTQLVGGTRDNPTFTLEPPIKECVGVGVISADVPFTYYTIDASNQWFCISQFSDTGGLDNRWKRFRKLTPGTYTPAEFVTHFNQVGLTAGYTEDWVDESSPERTPEGYQYGVKAFIDSTDGRLVLALLNFVNATPPTNLEYANINIPDPNFPDPNIGLLLNVKGIGGCAPNSVTQGSKIHEVLGFSQGYHFFRKNSNVRDNSENLLPAFASVVKGSLSVKLDGPRQMYLESNLASAVHGSVRSQLSSIPLLSFWPVNSKYQGTVDMLREKPIMIPTTSTSISKVQLSLKLGTRTVYGIPGKTTPYVQLNGESFRIGLRFYIKKDFEEQIQDEEGNNVKTISNRSLFEMPLKPSRRLR